MKSWPDILLIACAIVLVAFCITMLAILMGLPFGAFNFWGYWGVDGSVKATRSEVGRNFGLLAVAIGALLVGGWRASTANRQARIAEQGQVTDRFAKAVDMLGDDNSVTVRTGGIYALGRVARDSIEFDHIAVMQVLCQFVRNSPYAESQQKIAAEYDDNVRQYKEFGPEDDWADSPTPPASQECPDILAALEVISQRSAPQKDWEKNQDYVPSLRRARLGWLNLAGADCSNIEMINSDLRGAHLSGANFSGAQLIGAQLGWAYLTEANLSEADLSTANLMGADLRWANLSRANLSPANLNGANLGAANLNGVNLSGAILSAVNFNRANLSGTNLSGTYLSEAKNLTQAQIDDACVQKGSSPPELPDGLKPPTKIC